MAKRADKKRKSAPDPPHDEAPRDKTPWDKTDEALQSDDPEAVAAGPADEAEDTPAEDTPAEDTPAEDTPAEDTPAEVPPEERVAALETEAADLKDKLLRALAEAENVRRRGERDRADAAKYAVANFAREMVKAADNLRRALETVTDEARSENEALENLAVGLEITEREMLNAFERAGIRPIEALGQKFDHNLHEAMFELEDADHPAGTVVQVLETGYMVHDRLLRPAKVGVGKGGPDAAPVVEEDAPAPIEDDQAPPKSLPKTGPAKAYEKKDAAAGAKLDEKL
jgi:molecular chaperone GrpE